VISGKLKLSNIYNPFNHGLTSEDYYSSHLPKQLQTIASQQ